eukprot:1599044-Rhodomonas_salina.1
MTACGCLRLISPSWAQADRAYAATGPCYALPMQCVVLDMAGAYDLRTPPCPTALHLDCAMRGTDPGYAATLVG